MNSSREVEIPRTPRQQRVKARRMLVFLQTRKIMLAFPKETRHNCANYAIQRLLTEDVMANPTGINQYTKGGAGNNSAKTKAFKKATTRTQTFNAFSDAKHAQSRLAAHQRPTSKILQTTGSSKRATSFALVSKPYHPVKMTYRKK